MAPTVLSTASIPAKERLDYWHEMISRTYDQLASVREDISTPTHAPYEGTITADPLGPVPVATTDGDPCGSGRPCGASSERASTTSTSASRTAVCW